jgi:hypothetical protein
MAIPWVSEAVKQPDFQQPVEQFVDDLLQVDGLHRCAPGRIENAMTLASAD